MAQWRKADPVVAPGGDVGGDFQATDSYSVRLLPVSEPPDGYHAMVTVYFYGARVPAGHVGHRPRGFWVAEQMEFLICSDLADPGGTEVWSDYDYYDHPDRFPTAELADRAARELAVNVDCEALNWDGRSELR